MHDLHVVSLVYNLKVHKTVTFKDPPPVERETDEFRLRLEGNIATFEMKEHFGTEQDARRLVDGWLRAWELDAALRSERSIISFKFKQAEIVDRDPPPPGTPQVAKLSGSVGLRITAMPVTLHTTHNTYPDPPTRFKVSPELETMWFRFRGHLDGKEPLASMAYFCLTVFGKQKKDAKRYCVAYKVLRTLGHLTSEVGDRKTSRKFFASSPERPYTETETAWIKAAVRALIRRKAEYDADQSDTLRQLGMNDLPAI